MLFRGKKVIESYRAEQLEGLEKRDLMDFLPSIKDEDRWVLRKWVGHFKKKGVPFLVVEEKRGGKMVLWKRREAGM